MRQIYAPFSNLRTVVIPALKIWKNPIYVISSVDLDSYPFHNDIPWVQIQTGKLRYFGTGNSCHKRSNGEKKMK